MAYITLNKKHFFNNLDIIAKQTKAVDKIALVLKDNAYGHGLLEMAGMAKEYGITRAVVQLESEAVVIQDFFEYILILADTPKNPQKHFRYTINELQTIAIFPKNTRVELKVNTGMNRNGIEKSELHEAFKCIQKHALKLEAVFTHHGCADELNGFYEMQKESYKELKERVKELEKEFSYERLRLHSANSATLFREDDFYEDMARVGIAAYGCLNLPFASNVTKLKPILSLYAQRLSTRTIKSGCCVGYGATFTTQEDAVVSNYDFGYGAGFLRAASGRFKTSQGVTLIGRISMDNSSFLSDQDELLIFDDASYVSAAAGTISYEALTSLKPTLQRKIIEE